MPQPTLHHIAARWSLLQYPSPDKEWTLDQKFAEIKNAGFDGVIHPPIPELSTLAGKYGLSVLGNVVSSCASDLPGLLRANAECGAHHINAHVGNDNNTLGEAVELAILLVQEGRNLGLETAVEVHRGTCTETPEKAYALADVYQRRTGELLPITWDFSHFAILKHLVPDAFIDKLLIRPDLIQRAQQFHFRPFNGQHSQVPVTDGKGNLTQEVRDWFPFAEAVLQCWLDGNGNTDRDIYVCPEMGPIVSGYNLSTSPNNWEDAKILRVEIDKVWKKLIKN
jgi:sugar phosphate isomerase/epimerase